MESYKGSMASSKMFRKPRVGRVVDFAWEVGGLPRSEKRANPVTKGGVREWG